MFTVVQSSWVSAENAFSILLYSTACKGERKVLHKIQGLVIRKKLNFSKPTSDYIYKMKII